MAKNLLLNEYNDKNINTKNLIKDPSQSIDYTIQDLDAEKVLVKMGKYGKYQVLLI